MIYKEYRATIKKGFDKILDENLLFWNLWNISYPFEIFEKYKESYHQYFLVFNEMWTLCWKFNDLKNIDINKFHIVFDKTYPFNFDGEGNIIEAKGIQKDFQNLNEFHLPEACIKELTYSFGIVYDEILQNKRLIFLGDTVINIIDILLDSNNLGFLENNMDLPIVKDEVEAQIKLVTKLSKPQNFTYKDRNIYRSKLAMESITFRE